MSLHGDIRDGHLRIGEWSAERQPGTGGVHPYRWGVKLSSGPLARGVVVHDREDGTLGLVIKVLTAAVQQFGDRDHPEVPTAQAEPGHALAADVAARGYRERAERAEAARDALAATLARVRETAEHAQAAGPARADEEGDCPESECPTCTEEES